MNKTQLIKEVSKVLTNPKNAKPAVDSMLQAIKDALVGGDIVRLIGFGTFKTAERTQKVARNIHTAENVIVPAHTTVKFSPGKLLKDAVKKENQS